MYLDWKTRANLIWPRSTPFLIWNYTEYNKKWPTSSAAAVHSWHHPQQGILTWTQDWFEFESPENPFGTQKIFNQWFSSWLRILYRFQVCLFNQKNLIQCLSEFFLPKTAEEHLPAVAPLWPSCPCPSSVHLLTSSSSFFYFQPLVSWGLIMGGRLFGWGGARRTGISVTLEEKPSDSGLNNDKSPWAQLYRYSRRPPFS